jgi:hypothetical protein
LRGKSLEKFGSFWVTTSVDMNLFYAATNITMGHGKKTLFWEAPWLNGSKRRDIAPLIYIISTSKKGECEECFA